MLKTYLGSRNEDEAEFGAIGFLQRRGNFTKSRRRKRNQANKKCHAQHYYCVVLRQLCQLHKVNQDKKLLYKQ